MELSLVYRNPHTVLACLNETTDYLASSSPETPRLDAEVLLAHVLGLDKAGLYRNLYDIVPPSRREELRELADRRIKGEPVSYILGRKEFWSLTFTVGPGVMVPRPETETVVEAALASFPPGSSPRVLDLGTGSGCLAVVIARELPGATVFATDRSPQALAFARQNAAVHQVNITFVEGDLFQPVADRPAWFDLIVSNPPYIPSSHIPLLPAGLRDYEPHGAFDGGPDGLVFYRRIIDQAHTYLSAGGVLVLEVGYDQSEIVQKLIVDAGFYQAPETVKDLAGIERVVRTRRH
ncbi:MAG TPA: peptide chain release factor N(5)-glutamine methyltransferase [Thermodesulfobacteriota bacterium]|nr:peptide chain release factor N(5)-glutamine methyltransferase [Deltaproteobacteria bacterium]HNU70922.1 peptide chain release factor N(5)-glutamine methyltransferase [Thermodesulfobacteriota bacterium]HOC38365.1 peptide chain release factor N(5)-glutamine methyltransferase [Thermodesulfobacteriota bacterium]HQO79226.1 peptide chain release factor N(5)-glutamine methyltransferase [Thermodesulfobacteriota bacterium]